METNVMNFFYLDEDPWKSIEYHCDKHIVKMPTEYKQMLCTAHRVLDGEMYILIELKMVQKLKDGNIQTER